MKCTVNELLDPGWGCPFRGKERTDYIIGISSLIHWWKNL